MEIRLLRRSLGSQLWGVYYIGIFRGYGLFGDVIAHIMRNSSGPVRNYEQWDTSGVLAPEGVKQLATPPNQLQLHKNTHSHHQTPPHRHTHRARHRGTITVTQTDSDNDRLTSRKPDTHSQN